MISPSSTNKKYVPKAVGAIGSSSKVEFKKRSTIYNPRNNKLRREENEKRNIEIMKTALSNGTLFEKSLSREEAAQKVEAFL